MKRAVIPLSFGFGVTLAFVIGQKMGQEAMTVLLAVAVSAVISTVIATLLSWALRQITAQPVNQQPIQPVQPPQILLDPSALFEHGIKPPPSMNIGQDFKLLPEPKQDVRFAHQIPKVDKK